MFFRAASKFTGEMYQLPEFFFKFSNSSGRFLALRIETLVCTLDPSAAITTARKLLCFKLVAKLLRHPPPGVGALDMPWASQSRGSSAPAKVGTSLCQGRAVLGAMSCVSPILCWTIPKKRWKGGGEGWSAPRSDGRTWGHMGQRSGLS